jgi:hypothetical protein
VREQALRIAYNDDRKELDPTLLQGLEGRRSAPFEYTDGSTSGQSSSSSTDSRHDGAVFTGMT